MPLAYHVTLFLHVGAAIVWLGGMLAFVVIAPIVREVEDDAARQRLFQRLGERFRVVGWACIGVLLATGPLQLWFRGWWGAAVLGSSLFWGSPLGHTLALKLTAVMAMLVVQAIHDFWLGPLAGRAVPGTPRAQALGRRAALLARLNAVVGILLIWLAVQLARGS
jgi:putative copper resistance protein D